MSSSVALLQRYRLVLVAPRVPGNVGACARLVANFECFDWVIVDPKCSWDDWDAKKLATGSSRSLLEGIRVFSTLEQAVNDCHSAIGFTRRSGKIRKISVGLNDVAQLTESQGQIALVFGNEETGLTAQELAACTHVCELPTSEAKASMNLSHAVAVVLARIFEAESVALKSKTHPGRTQLANIEGLDSLMKHWRELLTDIGMPDASNPDRTLLTLRGILGRATLTQREIRALRGILSKTQVALGTRKQGKRVV